MSKKTTVKTIDKKAKNSTYHSNGTPVSKEVLQYSINDIKFKWYVVLVLFATLNFGFFVFDMIKLILG